MLLASVPAVITKAFPSLIWRISKEEKVIHLTFDDGPIPETTEWILNTLKQHQAKATFFCVGDNVRKFPDLYEKIIWEGHRVGNHTFNHLNGWKTDTDEYLNNIKKAKKHIHSRLFRPPHGMIKISQVQELKKEYDIVMWDVLSMDYDQKITPEQCLQNVTSNAKPGSIVVFHDSIKSWKNLQYALPKTLAYYTEKGYSFESLNLSAYQEPKPSMIEMWMNYSFLRKQA